MLGAAPTFGVVIETLRLLSMISEMLFRFADMLLTAIEPPVKVSFLNCLTLCWYNVTGVVFVTMFWDNELMYSITSIVGKTYCNPMKWNQSILICVSLIKTWK